LFKLLALILPLSLDTFAVSTALGMAGVSASARLRLSLLFAAFEAGMPLVGVVAGSAVSGVAGDAADFVAVAVLVGVGVWMLRSEADETPEAISARSRGIAAIGLGLSVSLDELAIGFTIGLLGLPIVLALVLIGLQAIVATQLGTRIGYRLREVTVFGESLGEQAERAAGLVLIGLAVLLLGLRLAGRSA
jgi:putative Mn2+ efflux pump MntP